MTTLIYIAQGTCGEYEDRMVWSVAAFMTLDMALEFVGRLNAKAKELGIHDRAAYDEQSMYDQHVLSQMHVLDPQAQMDYTGTHYDLLTCELWSALP